MYRLFSYSVIFLCGLGSSSFAMAQSSKTISLTLPQAVAIALKKNADIKSAYLQRVLDKFTLQLAKDDYRIQPSFSFDTVTSDLPKPFSRESDRQFGVTPGFTWNTPYSTQFAFSWSNTLSNGHYGDSESLTVTQPLLKGFGERIAEAPLDDALDQAINAKLTFRQTLISTITNILSDYRALQQAQMTMVTAQRALVNNKLHLKQDKLKVRSGDLAATELSQDEFQVAQQQVQIGSTRNSIKDAALKVLDDLGMGQGVHLRLPTDVEIPSVVPNRALSERIILANNVAYQEAVLGIKQAKRALLEARDSARWTLNLSATAARSSTFFSGGTQTDPNIPVTPSSQSVIAGNQVSLNFAIPVGKQRLQSQQSIASARIGLQNDIIKLKQQKLSLINQVGDQVERIQDDMSDLALAKKALALQRKTLQVTKEKIKYGMTSNFELFSQQTEYENAEQALIGKKISYLNDLAQFDQLLGTTLNTWHVQVQY
jgi:outer membrane protein TolC